MPTHDDPNTDAFLRLFREYRRLRWLVYVAYVAAVVTAALVGVAVGRGCGG